MSVAAGRLARWCTLKRLASAALVVLLAVGWWAFLRPSALGGPLTLVTVTGVSMEPGFHTGDLAVMRETDSYQKGDVVAFRARTGRGGDPGAYVIHRIVGGDATSGYVTRGDNNDWDDPWRPTAGDVTGELWFAVPGAGTGITWLAQPVHLAALLAAFAASLTMLGGQPEKTRPRKPRAARGVRPGLNHSGRYVGAAGVGGALAVLAMGVGGVPGSAAHLEVDGGVLQVFEIDGPGEDDLHGGNDPDRAAPRQPAQRS